jgi:hypothetical protein
VFILVASRLAVMTASPAGNAQEDTMNKTTGRKLCLVVAGVLSLSMGGFHLFLPRVFDWSRGMRSAPDSLEWALFSLNVFWSVLILLTGVLAIVLARRDWSEHAPGRAVLGALACYWLVHALYLLVFPFPLPANLQWLGTAFVGFALLQALLHGWPALARTETHVLVPASARN